MVEITILPFSSLLLFQFFFAKWIAIIITRNQQIKATGLIFYMATTRRLKKRTADRNPCLN
ncbi:hypothetical protein BD408DRAFT_409900, partial [Parasitella parasitica]